MPKHKLFPIVNQPQVKIYAAETSHFSVGTSPYYAHQKAVGLDIYDQLSIRNYNVMSPVSGKVLEIKEMRAPKPSFKGGINKEYLTVIQNPEDKHTVFKILHVKPELTVGKTLELGDPLGKTIRNGYFAPWSSPHIHLEIKKPHEVLRAKGGLYFELNTQNDIIKSSQLNEIHYKQIPVNVEFVCDEFLLCRLPDNLYFYIKPYYGVRGSTGQVNYIIDGGIPQYKHGIVHFHHNIYPKLITQVYFNKVKIATLRGFHKRFGFINFHKTKILMNDIPIRGISLFLAKYRPLIKLIPYKKEQFEITRNSIQYLEVHKH